MVSIKLSFVLFFNIHNPEEIVNYYKLYLGDSCIPMSLLFGPIHPSKADGEPILERTNPRESLIGNM